LSLLSMPLNVNVLTALADEPRSLAELRRIVGSPPQTTMRGHLRKLTEAGIVERRRHGDFPGSVDFRVGGPGRELLSVAAVLHGWLSEAPDGPLEIGSLGARGAVKALVEGWNSAIVRALSARPLSLTDIDRLIPGLNYPSLERRLGAMRFAGQIRSCKSHGKGTPYLATDWLRTAVAPLAAGAHWERRNRPPVEPPGPLGRLDVEAAFLLAVPMVELPDDVRGTCRLTVELPTGGERRLAGVSVTVGEGMVHSCVAHLGGDAEGWVTGSATDWLTALVEGQSALLEAGGESYLALAIAEDLHRILFRRSRVAVNRVG
jgi:DNA-binding HxlR family transcriptional regulator